MDVMRLKLECAEGEQRRVTGTDECALTFCRRSRLAARPSSTDEVRDWHGRDQASEWLEFFAHIMFN